MRGPCGDADPVSGVLKRNAAKCLEMGEKWKPKDEIQEEREEAHSPGGRSRRPSSGKSLKGLQGLHVGLARKGSLGGNKLLKNQI